MQTLLYRACHPMVDVLKFRGSSKGPKDLGKTGQFEAGPENQRGMRDRGLPRIEEGQRSALAGCGGYPELSCPL